MVALPGPASQHDIAIAGHRGNQVWGRYGSLSGCYVQVVSGLSYLVETAARSTSTAIRPGSAEQRVLQKEHDRPNTTHSGYASNPKHAQTCARNDKTDGADRNCSFCMPQAVRCARRAGLWRRGPRVVSMSSSAANSQHITSVCWNPAATRALLPNGGPEPSEVAYSSRV